VALQPGVRLAARLAGLGRVPKGLQDELEIVGRRQEHQQDAARRVPQPQDVLRRVRPVTRQAPQGASERPVSVLTARVPPRWVS
jgi:hypothetical protein